MAAARAMTPILFICLHTRGSRLEDSGGTSHAISTSVRSRMRPSLVRRPWVEVASMELELAAHRDQTASIMKKVGDGRGKRDGVSRRSQTRGYHTRGGFLEDGERDRVTRHGPADREKAFQDARIATGKEPFEKLTAAIASSCGLIVWA